MNLQKILTWVFQSPGPSQAPTNVEMIRETLQQDFNPQGPRRPRRYLGLIKKLSCRISIPGPSQAPTNINSRSGAIPIFQSPGPSQAPTPLVGDRDIGSYHFNPQGPRRPRRGASWRRSLDLWNFNPQGPRRPRHMWASRVVETEEFQSPGPSQAPTVSPNRMGHVPSHFNPQGPRRPRLPAHPFYEKFHGHFNPQGPRRPRPNIPAAFKTLELISIPRALAGPDPGRRSTLTTTRPFQSPGPSQAPT